LSALLFLSYSPAIFIAHVPRLPFNFVQFASRMQCPFGQLDFVSHMQIEKLEASVGHATNFSHAFLEPAL
jgi:hypothetical protein